MIYYISDTHFGDDRVRRLAGRAYSCVAEMDEDMVEKWNGRVRAEDDVYIVGDFAVDDRAAQIVMRLNGRKHLLLGNHDEVLTVATLRRFDTVREIATIEDAGRSVCLAHYPLLSYDRSIYGGYHVFGHIHNNPNDIAHFLQAQLPNALHCGADVVGFEPKSLDELIVLKRAGEV